MVFVDRVDAGRQLASRLATLRGEQLVVLGLPRGGVPVAAQVAAALGAALDVIVVRKLGVPWQPELGMGAIGEGGVAVRNDEVLRAAGVTDAVLAEVAAKERVELERRARLFRGGRPRCSLEGRTVVIVDDGIATGSTALAACQVARAQGAKRVVLAVPVAPPGWARQFRSVADECVALETPTPFFAIGEFYGDFTQTTDDEVMACLAAGATGPEGGAPAPSAGADPGGRDEEVIVRAGRTQLPGQLTIPERARGIVVFAHGSGSSRHSPRNRFVAGVLNQGGLGTLLFDLLVREEELDRGNVFDIELLAARLVGATEWLRSELGVDQPLVGYFGASTGAAAALWAATEPGNAVGAVVSRGGRPDLAAPRLAMVSAPTLLIVGGHDEEVVELNREAQRLLGGENRLAIVPGASHLFEEPGTLEVAAELARDWLVEHLSKPPAATTPL